MHNGEAGGIRLSEPAVAALRGTRPWALAVGGLWLAGIVVGGVTSIFFYSVFMPPGMTPAMATGMHALTIGIWAVEAVVIGVLATFALQYGRRLGRLATAPGEPGLEEAFDAQRRFWTAIGVAVIAAIALWILAFVAAIAIPVIVGVSHAA